MKLLFLTGSRGEWGYIRPILRLCQARNVEYNICATNMHLLSTFGSSIDEIKADGFEVSDEIFMSLEGHNHYTMTKSLGLFLVSFTDVLRRLRPDWVVLAGDRGEQLMGAVAAAYTYTPVAHIQAGEKSGNIDGVARHAIGKFSHLHFASNEDAAERLRRLGEEEFRIHLVGAPQLDELEQGLFTPTHELAQKYSIPLSEPYLLVIQHSVTEEYDQTESQIMATIDAVNQFDIPKIWIFPNNDAGSHFVRQSLLQNRTGKSYIFENLKREDYLGFLRGATCLVGNSSSGVLEAPSFKTPAVNLGRRQDGRIQGKNVINAPFEITEIVEAIRRAASADFRRVLANSVNPYGDGRSSEKIIKILSETRKDSKLLCKQLTY